MRLTTLFGLSLVIGLGLSVISPVHASTSAVSISSSLIGLNYRLVDLDLDDGITPWIEFNPMNTIIFEVVSEGGMLNTTISDANAPGLNFTELVSGDGATRANIDHSNYAVTLNVDEASLANKVAASFDPENDSVDVKFDFYSSLLYASGKQYDETGDTEGFRLSPNTQLVVEGSLNYQISTDLAVLKNSVLSSAEGWQEQFISIEASLGSGIVLYSIEDFGLDVIDFASNTGNNNVLVFAAEGYDEQFNEFNNLDFSIVYNNTSNVEKSAVFVIEMGASATVYAGADRAVISAIPEPGTYALMLLGLGGLAAALRRQQRQAIMY